MAPPILKVDPSDPTWGAIRAYAGERIAVLSRALEKKGMSEQDTAFIRGQLRELRSLIEQDTVTRVEPTHSIYT